MTIKEFWQSLLKGSSSEEATVPQADGVLIDGSADTAKSSTSLKDLAEVLKVVGLLPKDEEKKDVEQTQQEEKKAIDTSTIVIGVLASVIVITLLVLILKRR